MTFFSMAVNDKVLIDDVIDIFIFAWTCSSVTLKLAYQVFCLPQMETVIVTPGDSSAMASIVSARKNLFFTGTTSGTSLMECYKSNLQGIPMIPTGEKHKMMGSARVKDDSRSTSSKGALVACCISLQVVTQIQIS